MNPVYDQLQEKFDGVGWEDSHGQTVARVSPETWSEFARAVHDAGFEVGTDLTVVDRMRNSDSRFEVVANVLSMTHGLRLRMITTAEREQPEVASLTTIWPGLGFAEREAYDMFGIAFAGHPDLTRILMPDDWEGHPLLKDFGVGSVPVQFKASHQVT